MKNMFINVNITKKLLFLIICFVLCSGIAAVLIYSQNKNHSSEITENKDEKENKENNNDNENKDEENRESDYLFSKSFIQIIENIILVFAAGDLFFIWENDKMDYYYDGYDAMSWIGFKIKRIINNAFYKQYFSLFSGFNWFGFATLGSLIVITLLVEVIIDLLIGSISHFFSKDKNKKYLHTLKMSLKKRIQLFSSFSKIKIFFITLCYLLCAFVIAVIARMSSNFGVCRCRDGDNKVIIKDHGRTYCCGFCDLFFNKIKFYKDEKNEIEFVPMLTEKDKKITW